MDEHLHPLADTSIAILPYVIVGLAISPVRARVPPDSLFARHVSELDSVSVLPTCAVLKFAGVRTLMMELTVIILYSLTRGAWLLWLEEVFGVGKCSPAF